MLWVDTDSKGIQEESMGGEGCTKMQEDDRYVWEEPGAKIMGVEGGDGDGQQGR